MDKIILITSNIAPYRLRWCEELSKHFDVTIYYTKDREKDYNDEFLKHDSSTCHIVKMKNYYDNGLDPLCFDVIDIIQNNKEAFIIFDGYGPKTNLLGLLYCRLKGIDNYVNVDGYPTERKKSAVKEFIKKLVIKNLCRGFFCSGEATKQHLIHYGADANRIVVHNFSSITEDRIIDAPLVKEEKRIIREELGINTDKQIVLGVGRFVPLKRFEDLIKAVLICNSECELYLLGGKPTEKYLELSKNSRNIHYLDFVLPEEVDKYYKAADLFVLPSETDVWGLVINEAMAQGLPVIVSDSPVGGHSLVDGNGFIFETYNVDELSKDIDLCLEDKNNFEMSKRSLEIIHDYTIEGMVERQLQTIRNYFTEKQHER